MVNERQNSNSNRKKNNTAIEGATQLQNKTNQEIMQINSVTGSGNKELQKENKKLRNELEQNGLCSANLQN
jgi:hypothetical protein